MVNSARNLAKSNLSSTIDEKLASFKTNPPKNNNDELAALLSDDFVMENRQFVKFFNILESTENKKFHDFFDKLNPS